MPVQESQGSGVTDTFVGGGVEKGPATLGQAEQVLRKAPALGIPTWMSLTLPSQTACAALLELPLPSPRPPVHPPARHRGWSWFTTFSMQTPQEGKRRKGNMLLSGSKGSGPLLQLEEVLLMALWGQQGCFQGNSLEQFWLSLPALEVVVPLGFQSCSSWPFLQSWLY